MMRHFIWLFFMFRLENPQKVLKAYATSETIISDDHYYIVISIVTFL